MMFEQTGWDVSGAADKLNTSLFKPIDAIPNLKHKKSKKVSSKTTRTNCKDSKISKGLVSEYIKERQRRKKVKQTPHTNQHTSNGDNPPTQSIVQDVKEIRKIFKKNKYKDFDKLKDGIETKNLLESQHSEKSDAASIKNKKGTPKIQASNISKPEGKLASKKKRKQEQQIQGKPLSNPIIEKKKKLKISLNKNKEDLVNKKRVSNNSKNEARKGKKIRNQEDKEHKESPATVANEKGRLNHAKNKDNKANKKTQDADTNTNGISPPEKKQRKRHRKKKSNPSKNKFAHLAKSRSINNDTPSENRDSGIVSESTSQEGNSKRHKKEKRKIQTDNAKAEGTFPKKKKKKLDIVSSTPKKGKPDTDLQPHKRATHGSLKPPSKRKSMMIFDSARLKAILNDQGGLTLTNVQTVTESVSKQKKAKMTPNEEHRKHDEQLHVKSSVKIKGDVATKDEQKSFHDKMVDRLHAARFRYLNEQLYTCTGDKAMQLFADDREAFGVYHDGFQAQVAKWPSNPVDAIIDKIKQQGKKVVVADFGCGDAKIAQSLPNKVHSFDLVAVNKHITACDIAKVPLRDHCVDVAVFCLSLMGTNLTDYIAEAHRVLKKKGTMYVAEVVSRFDRLGKFIIQVEQLGFKIEKQDSTNKMFVMLEFRKHGPSNPATRPTIELMPCMYKRR